MFGKKKEKTTKKIDKLVTGIIIGWAVASIFGLSRTKKWQEVTTEIEKKWKGVFWWMYWIFWKGMSKAVKTVKKKK